ncbi:MAG TPA: pyridoxal phosphate-dependent aminotransferase [bacterium]|nr:pyridoxal phosphate-dependent aminotransferase [bacterium]
MPVDIRISQRVTNLKPSATLAIDARAKELIAQGIDVVNLGAGEPDFHTPEPIREAAIAAIRDGFTRYTPVSGTADLRTAIATALKRDQGLVYDPHKEIIVSVGAKHSLYNFFLAVLDPGDEAILPAPYWVSYPDMIGLAGAKAVIVGSTPEKGFVPDLDDVRKAVTAKTRVIVLNSPSNPTGAGYPREFIEGVAKLAVEKGLLIVSDEIYRDITYDGFVNTSPAELSPDAKAHTILVNGVSKTYAMTGWRIGFAAGDARVVKAMSTLQGQSTSNPTSIAQVAAAAAFLAPREIVTGMVAEFRKRMEYVVGALNAIPGVKCPRPRGAFYVFPDLSAHYGKKHAGKPITNSTEMAAYLLEVGRVAAVAGGPFGADRHIRISFATSMANLEKAVARIGDALGKLS